MGPGHEWAMRAYWWEMLLLSLAVIPRWTTQTTSMTDCIFSTLVSCGPIRHGTRLLTLSASRQWSRASPHGPKPAGRYGHSLNILGSKIYIFGGQVEGYFFNDLIAYDLNTLQLPTNKWEFLIHNSDETDLEKESGPPARTNHSIVSYNDQLYL